MSLEGDIKDIRDGKVDSRRTINKETHSIFPMERTHCVFCGKAKGYVSQESADWIAAENVVVVCDDCNSKIEEKLGKLPLEQALVQEYSLKDAELGMAENVIGADWVENCIDCHLPMVLLQPISVSKCAPLMDTLRTGDTKVTDQWMLRIKQQALTATPQWFCRKCMSLWGPIDLFWCKFRKV